MNIFIQIKVQFSIAILYFLRNITIQYLGMYFSKCSLPTDWNWLFSFCLFISQLLNKFKFFNSRLFWFGFSFCYNFKIDLLLWTVGIILIIFNLAICKRKILVIDENLIDFVGKWDFNLFGQLYLIKGKLKFIPEPDIALQQIEIILKLRYLIHIIKLTPIITIMLY